MSDLTLLPNGPGKSTQHSRNTGSSNWSVMTSDDGDVSYVFSQSNGAGGALFATDLYAMANSGGQIGAIDQLQVNVKARYWHLEPGGVAQIQPLLRFGSTNYGPGLVNLASNYATYSYARTTHPGTGLPFTWADIDGLQAGLTSFVSDVGGLPTSMRATYLWSVVTFHLALRPGGPASVGVVPQQAELRLHLLLTPGGAAIVPVTAEDAELLIGVAPARDPLVVFDLQLRGSGQLALSLARAQELFLGLRKAGVIEAELSSKSAHELSLELKRSGEIEAKS